MTTRLEWLTAEATRALLIDPGQEAPDGQVAEIGDHVLVLSHGDSYGVAIAGTPDELLALFSRAAGLVAQVERPRLSSGPVRRLSVEELGLTPPAEEGS